ncbi:MAG: hypothetical protein U1E98_01480 [Moraxella osloensis]
MLPLSQCIIVGFLLSDYDRVRRLPNPPFLPNYQADPLTAPIAKFGWSCPVIKLLSNQKRLEQLAILKR